jgi:hypothetical protein
MRTVNGFFNSRSDADNALAALEHEGFSRADISMVAHDPRQADDTPKIGPVHEVGEDTETGRDTAIGGIAGAVAGLILVLIPGIGPLAAVGPIAGLIGGLGIGAAAGGVVGLFKDMGMSHEEAEYYAEGIRRGGAMLSIKCDEGDNCNRIERVMKENGAVDIQDRAREWRESGWKGYDPKAEVYPEVRRA